MTILTVRANDTATAMEEIVEKLGTESYILDTKKVGNEMLVKATNNPGKKPKAEKRLPHNFSNMMSKELSDKLSGGNDMVCKGKETGIKTASQFSSQNNSGLTGLEQLGTELQALRSALDGMVLTDMAGLSPNLQSTTKVKLQNLGFSSHLLRKLRCSFSSPRVGWTIFLQ